MRSAKPAIDCNTREIGWLRVFVIGGSQSLTKQLASLGGVPGSRIEDIVDIGCQSALGTGRIDMELEPTMPGPLQGLYVLDISRFICGNMLTMLLADFGADVVKVEAPKKGDPLRDLRDRGRSLHWDVYARGKRSLSLDLRDKAGKAVLLDLVEKADVLVESFKPGTLEKMEIGPDVLLARNPSLVIVRISGFGQTGAYRDRPGFGTLVEAMSGFAAKNGLPEGPPTLPNMAMADMVAGLYGAFATMVAINSRRGAGRGQVIDLSLLEPMISILGPDPAIHALTGQIPGRSGSRSHVVAPRNIYQAGDNKYMAISASTQSMVVRLFTVIGRPELVDDARFRTNENRLRHVVELDSIISDWLALRNRDEALAAFRETGVTAGPVYDVSQLIDDEHVKTREVLVNAPGSEGENVLMHNVIPRLSKTPGAIRRSAPRLGSDTEAVLREIGYDASTISKLVQEGIVTLAEGSRRALST